MTKAKLEKITLGQAQYLLRGAVAFRTLPERVGELTFKFEERSGAQLELWDLMRELTSRSPLWQKHKRIQFGPESEWEQKGPGIAALKDNEKEVEIRITERARTAAFWLCVLGIHPQSGEIEPLPTQLETILPLAERLRFRDKLFDYCGFGESKAVHRMIDYDPEEGAESAVEEGEVSQEATGKSDGKAAETVKA